MFAKSNILLIGSGGVGTIVALNLEAGGLASVTAVCRSNYDQVTSKGFTIRSCDHGELHEWRPSKIVNKAPTASRENKYDYIVCTTKNLPDQTPTLASLIAPAVTPGHTTIVLLQNGINIETPLFTAFPDNTVLSGISYIRSHELQPGIIDHIDHDKLIIGPFRNPRLLRAHEQAVARRFGEMYANGRRTVCLYDEGVAVARWRKLVYNACVNSVCAVTGLDTGRVQETGSLIEGVVRPAMWEIVEAARAAGVLLPDGVVEDVVGHLEPVDMHFSPSMLVDVDKGNFLEYENIVGEPLRIGTRLGVSMPTLHVIYHILQAFQWRTAEARKAPKID